jgi:hypothetical protein
VSGSKVRSMGSRVSSAWCASGQGGSQPYSLWGCSTGPQVDMHSTFPCFNCAHRASVPCLCRGLGGCGSHSGLFQGVLHCWSAWSADQCCTSSTSKVLCTASPSLLMAGKDGRFLHSRVWGSQPLALAAPALQPPSCRRRGSTQGSRLGLEALSSLGPSLALIVAVFLFLL